MEIKEEKITKYVELYVEEFGQSIDRAQARAKLVSLICLLDAVFKFNNKNYGKNNDNKKN